LDRAQALLRPRIREAAVHPWSIARDSPVLELEAVVRIPVTWDLATGRQYMIRERIGTAE